jgi:hypothetical protein
MRGFGLIMDSISTQYYQFLLLQGVYSAIGVAAVFQPALSCIMGWFDKKHGIEYEILPTGSFRWRYLPHYDNPSHQGG